MTVKPRTSPTKAKKPAKPRRESKTPAVSVANPVGRPSDYQDVFAKQAAKLCELGATDMELANFFGVETRTIYRWRNSVPEFCQSVVVGKEAADERVKRSLFNRAVGYTFESEKVFQFQGQIVRAQTTEHVPPDPGAALNWLKNRQPGEWRENVNVNIGVSNMSDEEIAARLVALAAKAAGGK